MTLKKQKRQKTVFSPQFKQKVKQYFQEGKSLIEIQKLLNMAPNQKQNLYLWHRLFLKNAFYPSKTLAKKNQRLKKHP